MRHELEAALKDLLEASELDPTALRPLELLGDVNGALLRYDRAAARYQAYLAIDDQSPRVLYKLGLVRYRAGQPADGVPVLRKALALDPRFAEAQYVLGLCLADVRQYTDAEGVEVALGRVWLEAAQLHGDRIALAKALEALEGAVGSDDSSEALTLFGRALLLASDQDLAERMLQDATTREPVDPTAFFYLADAAERCEHPKVARQALVDYRTLTGDERDARRRVAMAERIGALSMRAQDAPAAVTWFTRALDAGGPDTVILVHLAQAQIAAGDPDAARQTVARALEHEPQNAAARALARQLR